MKLSFVVAIVGMTAATLHAEDFTLKFFTDGPIRLHTALSVEGDHVRLLATAKNESALPIQRAKICITSPSMKSGCLFEVWNTAVWAPGAEMNWNLVSSKRIPTLAHDAMIEDYVNAQLSPTVTQAETDHTASPRLNPGTTSNASEPMTNETIIKLGKAGLGDDVILDMVNSRPGKYRRGPDDIIELKQAGISDKVITAVLNKDAEPDFDVPLSPSQGAISGAKIETNAKLYIEPMTSNLDEFIGAEVVKQHLSVRVVLNEKDADYILSGLSQKTEVKWYDVVSGSVVGGKDRLEASAKLVRVRDKAFVWAGESGDRSLIFGALKRGGQRKLAERIVNQMKRDLF